MADFYAKHRFEEPTAATFKEPTAVAEGWIGRKWQARKDVQGLNKLAKAQGHFGIERPRLEGVTARLIELEAGMAGVSETTEAEAQGTQTLIVADAAFMALRGDQKLKVLQKGEQRLVADFVPGIEAVPHKMRVSMFTRKGAPKQTAFPLTVSFNAQATHEKDKASKQFVHFEITTQPVDHGTIKPQFQFLGAYVSAEGGGDDIVVSVDDGDVFGVGGEVAVLKPFSVMHVDTPERWPNQTTRKIHLTFVPL